MKKKFVIFFLFLSVLSGCGTINAERKAYMTDSVYEKERYLGGDVSEPRFSHYDLRGKYDVSKGSLKVYVDPLEVYTQEKEQFVVRQEVTYKRYGPYGYSPVGCAFGVVTVFPLLFAIFDDSYARNLKKSCYKVYEWRKKNNDLPAERLGTEEVEIVERNYTDSQVGLYLQIYANGKQVNRQGLSGFSGKERRGAYVWTVNDWFDFSRLDSGAKLRVDITNIRGSKTLSKSMVLTNEESEALVFNGKYDGLVQYYYVCSKCNADLQTNYYSDAQRIVWFSGMYKFKADRGSDLDRVASCLGERFNTTGSNGYVTLMRANTPAEAAREWPMAYQAYGRVQPNGRIDKPGIEDLQACARSKRLQVTFEQ